MTLSYKFETMLAILRMLDKGETVTLASLAERYGVSTKSAERYIRTLKNAGFPVAHDRQKKSYTFKNGYTLKAATFSPEESLVFGLAKDMLNKDFGPGTATVLCAIEKKIGLCVAGLPKHIVLAANIQSPSVEEYFRALNHAIPDCRRVEIAYEALHNRKETCRKVDPYYLFYSDGIWLLRGYCHLRKEMRTFALDKIASLKTLDGHFLPKPDVSPGDELSGTFGSMVDGEPATIVLRFMKEFAPYIQRRKWHPSQQVKELGGGAIEVTFHVNGFKGIKPWIYRWIPYVEVIAPKELKQLVNNEFRDALKNFE